MGPSSADNRSASGQLSRPDVSVVMPCLDEEASVAECVATALEAMQEAGLDGEVVVVDNGSRDASAERAAASGARVVREERRGYGRALRRGIQEARGRYVVLGDADGSYDFSAVPGFVERLSAGADLVMGSRFGGTIQEGAMPWSHRYLGNPVLTWLLNRLFGCRVSDSHCGLRALTQQAAARIRPVTAGMEFASEIVIRAGQEGLRVEEVPITYRPRAGESKLRTWRDGWRHLRFMLLLSPTWLLLVPGLAMAVAGFVVAAALVGGPVNVAGRPIDIHVQVLGGLVSLLGVQLALLGLTARSYAAQKGYGSDRLAAGLRRVFTLERGLVLGGLVFLAGFAMDAVILADWVASRFDSLDAVRPAFLALVLMVVGAQIAFSALFFSMLDIPLEEGEG